MAISIREITIASVVLMTAAPLHSQMRLERKLEISGHQVEFGRISSVVADENGSIYIADSGTKHVVVLDSLGQRKGNLGRAGSGPGEFGDLGPTAHYGDGLAVYDWRRGRSVRFLDDDGRETGSVSWPNPTSGLFPLGQMLLNGGDELYGMAVLRATSVITDFDAPAPPAPPVVPQYLHFLRDGTARALPINRWDPFDLWLGNQDCGTRDDFIHILRVPFTTRGPLVAFLPQDEVAIAYRDQYRIDILRTTTGAVVRTYRRDVAPIAVTDDIWNAQPEIREARQIEAEHGPMTGRGRTPCPVLQRPRFQPVLRTLVSDRNGRLWAESTTAQGFSLTGIGPRGELLGEAAMPNRDPNVAPYVAGNRLYIVTVDDLDVQSLEVYDIVLN